jgi:hypothetical protein
MPSLFSQRRPAPGEASLPSARWTLSGWSSDGSYSVGSSLAHNPGFATIVRIKASNCRRGHDWLTATVAVSSSDGAALRSGTG